MRFRVTFWFKVRKHLRCVREGNICTQLVFNPWIVKVCGVGVPSVGTPTLASLCDLISHLCNVFIRSLGWKRPMGFGDYIRRAWGVYVGDRRLAEYLTPSKIYNITFVAGFLNWCLSEWWSQSKLLPLMVLQSRATRETQIGSSNQAYCSAWKYY